MGEFRLDEGEVRLLLEQGAAEAKREGSDLFDRACAGACLPAGSAAALWTDRRISDESLWEAARGLRGARARQIETFCPLYMTNTCDGTCLMCGMRSGNGALVRDTADMERIEEQLRTLLARGIRAVALLTGEYRTERRQWAISYVNEGLRTALRLGFCHVLINVGSLDVDEFPLVLDGVPRHADGSVVPKITICTFQETYSRDVYAKFMGRDPDNPRSSYERRLTNFDRARRAGLRVANPGILLGLSTDVAFEIASTILHVRHLLAAGMEVYLSVPRMRQVAGGSVCRGMIDDDFMRVVSVLSLVLPDAKLVITTREPREIQQRLAPIVSVLSAGSSAVAPYTRDGARFRLESSQFRVVDQRPFEAILREYLGAGVEIRNFTPPA